MTFAKAQLAYQGTVAATAIGAFYWMQAVLPSVLEEDGRSGVALIVLIAVAAVSFIAIIGFIFLQVFSELYEEEVKDAQKEE